MSRMSFQSSEWFNAITLKERIGIFASFDKKKSGNRDLAERHLKKWRNQPPFTDNEIFKQNLSVNNLNEKSFRQILGLTTIELQEVISSRPNWLDDVEKAFLNFNKENDKTDVRCNITQSRIDTLFTPLINEGKRKFTEGIENFSKTYQTIPFDSIQIQQMFLDKLFQTLALISHKTLVLEVNVARLREELKGDTPEERYKYFFNKLKDSNFALSILEEYSVLTRQAVITINNWVHTSLEFLQHLCKDWQELCESFNSGKPLGKIDSLDVGAGDSHRSGHSVIILTFDTGVKLVYKPRSLSIDTAFQHLLLWLNEKGNHPTLRTLNILDQNSHGWVEYVHYKNCKSEDEVKNYYVRQGCLLALLYLLEATDFHAENLIANGEHPVLVDLEALFHPRVKESESLSHKIPHKIGHSVIRTGLLPQKMWIGGSENEQGIDLSGIGNKDGQTMPFRVPQWEKANTDEIHLVLKSIKIQGNSNRPKLNEKEVNPLHYRKYFIEGFESTYKLLEHYREELLDENGLLDSFAACEIRFISRATRTFSVLLNESYHPDYLRNAIDRDRLFDQLWAEVKNQPHLAEIIKYEIQDLQLGDIPFFSTRPNSSHIYSSSGKCITNFLEKSGLEIVRKRFLNFSKNDLERQIWFINASFTSLSMGLEEVLSWECEPHKRVFEPYSTNPIEIAKHIGNRLILLADQQDKWVSWTGVSLLGEKTWSLSPVGHDFFHGLPGIIMFLSYLGLQTSENKYAEFAQRAFETLKLQLSTLNKEQMTIGAFDGMGGLLYLYLHLGTIWQDSDLLSEAEKSAESIRVLISKDRAMDVISGSAGAILSLFALYNYKPSSNVADTIVRCGDHLLAHSKQMNRGLGWETLASKTPLAGISHGCAGIAYSLLIASFVSGENRFREAAKEALVYEKSLFSPEVGNWLDIREDNTSSTELKNDLPKYMTAWCHGAPGIGMARLACLNFLDDSMLKQDVEIAIKTTLETGFGQNHSLCHGDLGNLDFLLQVQQKGFPFDVEKQIKELTSNIYKSINHYGWLCGIPMNIETPGLMTGLAGIGYEFLRIHNPTRIPSILILDSPINI